MDGEQICSSDESLKSVCAPEEWVVVANAIGSKAIEIPLCPSHGVLHVRTVRNVFKDATGLKYRNPDTGLDRVLSETESGRPSVAASAGLLPGLNVLPSFRRKPPLQASCKMNHDETCFLAPTGGWKNKMFIVVRPVKFVRLQGNTKKQVKRSLANKPKATADMDPNSNGKIRSILASSKANSVSAASESAY